MDRRLTNKIRYVLDEWLPPAIRDSRWFMYPLFYIWFRGRNVQAFMDLKANFHKMDTQEWTDIYASLSDQWKVRPTDLTASSLAAILTALDRDSQSVLDVGCGRGILMQEMSDVGFKVAGCDLVNNLDNQEFDFTEGSIEKLPFEDNAFDIVTCSHTLEHVVHLHRALKELKRVAARQLIICVPRQRYYYYTMDLHLQFFPTEGFLCAPIELEDYTIQDCDGDWVYQARMPDCDL